MTSFLFWNLNQRPLQERVVRISLAYDVDVIMLVECAIAPTAIRDALNAKAVKPYCFPWSAGEKIRILTRLPEDSIIDQFNDNLGRLTIRTLKIGASPEILLAVAHYPSRLRWDRSNQSAYVSEFAQDILRVEGEACHQRTILVGDLNMNPFDDAVVKAQGLHAVMTRTQAGQMERTVEGRRYRYFYNPMWGHFGDRTVGPPGTYYYGAALPVNCFWNIFDQVLLRPSLMDLLDDLQILDTDGYESLLTKSGRPRTTDCSDHLPVFFRMSL